MKKNFLNINKVAIFCLLTLALINISTTVFAAENETARTTKMFAKSYDIVASSENKASIAGNSSAAKNTAELTENQIPEEGVVISNSGKVRNTPIVVAGEKSFPDRTFVVGQ